MKKFLLYFSLLLIALLVFFQFTIYPKLDLISGFSAKNVASAHFIDGRSLETIEQGDNDIKLVNLAKNAIFDDELAATSSVYGLKKRRAVFRPGLGAVLVDDNYQENAKYSVPNRSNAKNKKPYPYGDANAPDTVFKNVDYTQLEKAVSNAFDANAVDKQKRTRAVLVIYKNKIIAEKYAPGFTKDSRILGWSMTKSITATLFGILQYQGKMDVMKPAQISEWKSDERSKITINNLLHMNSGLEWEEKYDKISDATKMLFQEDDMTKSQIAKPQLFAPEKQWNYSSGTSNLLSGILRSQFRTHQEYLDFWYSALIDRIGMHSMLVETDLQGNFVGSSYGWATTRDWGKFGLLYLHKGNWDGDQVFDPKWVDYVTTPTATSDGVYGAHFWLNAGGKFKDVPKDMYSSNGFQGQRVFIIPSQDLVIVRLGLTDATTFDFNIFLKEVISSIKK